MKIEHGIQTAQDTGAVLSWAIAQAPKSDSAPCGDGYLIQRSDGTLFIAIADGVGSGAEAHEASNICLRALSESAVGPLPGLFQRCHQALIGSRGAALAIVVFDLARGHMEWAAVGDIDGCVYPCQSAPDFAGSLIQRGGTLGHHFTGAQAQRIALTSGSMATLSTDGVSRRARDANPLGATPEQFASACMTRFGRNNDDRTFCAFVWTEAET